MLSNATEQSVVCVRLSEASPLNLTPVTSLSRHGTCSMLNSLRSCRGSANPSRQTV
jgi:hypothetical protein